MQETRKGARERLTEGRAAVGMLTGVQSGNNPARTGNGTCGNTCVPIVVHTQR
jgi:hypothetical protein